MMKGPEGHECDHPLFTGVVFLGLREARSGRWFAAWMNPVRADDATLDDWFAYTDTLAAENGPLGRLEADAARIGMRRVSVAVMMPALARGRRSLPARSGSIAAATAGERSALYAQYLDSLRARVGRGSFRHVRLTAVYWLDEAVWGGDEPSVAIVAAHARGLEAFWIPYYDAGGWDRWRELGFDAAWQQPNYFFGATLPRERLDSAVARARAAGMGLELELDRRVTVDSGARQRLRESIAAIRASNVRNLVVYDGAGALYELFTSEEPVLQAVGHEISELLCER